MNDSVHHADVFSYFTKLHDFLSTAESSSDEGEGIVLVCVLNATIFGKLTPYCTVHIMSLNEYLPATVLIL